MREAAGVGSMRETPTRLASLATLPRKRGRDNPVLRSAVQQPYTIALSLWGRVGEGGRCYWTRRVRQLSPPPHPLPKPKSDVSDFGHFMRRRTRVNPSSGGEGSPAEFAAPPFASSFSACPARHFAQ